MKLRRQKKRFAGDWSSSAKVRKSRNSNSAALKPLEDGGPDDELTKMLEELLRLLELPDAEPGPPFDKS